MVDRSHLPLFDEFDDHAPGTLTWLQAWYAAQCDGDWEHSFGVRIDTLDNPGWSLRVDLRGTDAVDKPFAENEVNRSEHDWIHIRVADKEFKASGGPLNLGELLHEFRLWIDGPPKIAHHRRDPE